MLIEEDVMETLLLSPSFWMYANRTLSPHLTGLRLCLLVVHQINRFPR